MMIEGVELNLYYTNGENECIPLSATQATIVMKILGLSKEKNGNISCFSDESLDKMAEMRGNPLHLKKIDY